MSVMNPMVAAYMAGNQSNPGVQAYQRQQAQQGGYSSPWAQPTGSFGPSGVIAGGGGTSPQFAALGAGSGQSGAPQYDILNTLTPQQQQVNAGLVNQVAQGNNLYAGQQQQMGTALQNALTANPASTIDPTATAQYVQNSVAMPMLRQFDQTISPRLNDAYAAAGALMGSRRGFANSQALQSLQSTVAQQLGQAQLSNQQLTANLNQQTAQRQAQTVNQLQQQALGTGQLGLGIANQQQQAIQPYRNYGNMLGQNQQMLEQQGAQMPFQMNGQQGQQNTRTMTMPMPNNTTAFGAAPDQQTQNQGFEGEYQGSQQQQQQPIDMSGGYPTEQNGGFTPNNQAGSPQDYINNFQNAPVGQSFSDILSQVLAA